MFSFTKIPKDMNEMRGDVVEYVKVVKKCDVC